MVISREGKPLPMRFQLPRPAGAGKRTGQRILARRTRVSQQFSGLQARLSCDGLFFGYSRWAGVFLRQSLKTSQMLNVPVASRGTFERKSEEFKRNCDRSLLQTATWLNAITGQCLKKQSARGEISRVHKTNQSLGWTRQRVRRAR